MTKPLGPDRPFPGLRPYCAQDHAWFFGRDEQSLALYRLLDRGRLIAVVGSSGSGKSSVLRAGLTPLLEEETSCNAGRRWRWWEMRPGDAPISRLAEALAGGVDQNEEARCPVRAARMERLEFVLRKSSFGLRDALREAGAEDGSSLVILVDQFEEVFRFADLPGTEAARAARREEAAAFVQLVMEATRTLDSPVRVVLTMRSDYLGDCARFHGLPEAITAGEYLVPSLTRDQRTQAIRGPIEKAGATISDELVERLLNDSNDELDQLPVLQHALMRTWMRAEAGTASHLTTRDYEEIGGIASAISRHADELMSQQGVQDDWQLALEQVFRALAELDRQGRGIRRPLPFDQLVAETGMPQSSVRAVVNRFRRDDCSFLATSVDDDRPLKGTDIVDVGHESLIRRWSRMTREVGGVRHGWLIDEVADGRTYVALLETARGAAPGCPASLPLDQVETRTQWWRSRPRSRTWAERYGGDIDKVEELLSNSTAALENRKREQKEKNDLESKLQRERAGKKIRSRIAVAGLLAGFVMSAVSVFAIMQTHELRDKTGQLEAKREELEKAKQNAEDLLAQETSLREELDKALLQSQQDTRTVGKLRDAAVELGKKLEKEAIRRQEAVERAASAMLSTQANLVNREAGKAELAILLGIAAHRVSKTPDAARSIFRESERLAHLRLIHAPPLRNPAAAVSAAANLVLWAGADGSWSLQRLDDKEVISRSPPRAARRAPGSADTSRPDTPTDSPPVAALSKDGKTIALGFIDGRMQIWDASQSVPTLLAEDASTKDPAGVLAFGSDGSRLAAGSITGSVTLWQVERASAAGPAKWSSVQLPSPPVPARSILSRRRVSDLAFNMKDDKLAAAIQGESLPVVWNLNDRPGFPRYTLVSDKERGGPRAIASVAFHPRLSDHLFSLNSEHGVVSVTRWDVGTDKPASAETRLTSAVGGFGNDVERSLPRKLRIAPNGSVFAVGTDAGLIRVAVLSGRNWTFPAPGGSAITSLEFAADSRSVIGVAADGRIANWSVPAPPSTVERRSTWTAGAMSANGKECVIFGSQPHSPSEAMGCRQWSPAGVDNVVAAAFGKKHSVSTVAFASEKGEISVRDAVTQKLLHTFRAPSAVSVDVSPTGMIAAGGINNQVVLWNTTKPQSPPTVLAEHTSKVLTVAFNPSGTLLASGGDDGRVIIWETRSGQRIQEFRTRTEWGRSFAFHPTAPVLASGTDEGPIFLYGLSERAQVGVLNAHHTDVRALAFSSSGRYIASGDDDGVVIVWDYAARKETGIRFARTAQRVLSLQFAPGEMSLLVLWSDGKKESVPLDGSNLIAELCRRVTRNLSDSEWKDYAREVDYQVQCPGLPKANG
jgi:WD40 repeat protein